MTLPPTQIRSKFLSHPSDLGIVAVGFAGGQMKPGVDAAPTALISAGLLSQLAHDLCYTLHHDETVHTYAALIPAHDPPIRGMKNPRAVSAVTERIAQQVYAHAAQGRMVLTLGGDHSIAIGTVAGVVRAIAERGVGGDAATGRGRGECGLIWVDAHADINTPEMSVSGNVHGMPVAWLGGLSQEGEGEKWDSEGAFGWLEGIRRGVGERRRRRGVVDLKRVVYIGLRDVERGEREILRREGIRAFSMHDIDKHGIGHIMELALEHLGPDTPIHLSFDVDALDPQWAPSTGTPVRGGLTLREGDYIAESVHETGNLVAVDLVEVNPSLEDAGAAETIRAGCSIVRCSLGDTLL